MSTTISWKFAGGVEAAEFLGKCYHDTISLNVIMRERREESSASVCEVILSQAWHCVDTVNAIQILTDPIEVNGWRGSDLPPSSGLACSRIAGQRLGASRRHVYTGHGV